MPLAVDPSSAEVDSQPEHTAADIEAAHTAVDTAVDHTVADSMAVVDTAEVVDTETAAHTDLFAHSSSVRLVQALLLSDYHSLHKSASLVHSVDHSLCKLLERLEPFVALRLAYYIRNGRKKRSQRELVHGKQGRDASQAVEVL